MTYQEYRDDLLNQIRVNAEVESDFLASVFVRTALDNLVSLEVIPSYEQCYAEPLGRRGKKLRIDAYYYDDFDNIMYFIIADFDGSAGIQTITKTQSKQVFDKLEGLIDEALNRNLMSSLEISSPVFDAVAVLCDKDRRKDKFSLILITDKVASERIDNIPSSSVGAIPVEYHVWDITRFFKAFTSDSGKEEIEIEFNEGLPCLYASNIDSPDYKSYLCVIPGTSLAELYEKYGSRLLEGNIRSFLTTKRAVNRNIRETILRLPERFFAYNNGISTTATDVETISSTSGTRISKIKGLQIVNGGQTTASLYNARVKDGSSLEKVFVPMKLTRVTPAIAQDVIPEISRSSNSQNKVSEADFFSNHPFHIQMEKLSKRIFAPSVQGNQYETKWFYERATGQYVQEQARKKPQEKKRFLLEYPNDQQFTKTELAKILNTYMKLPHKVSLGAQKNFSLFADWVSSEWDRDSSQFNEVFFKECISKLILFKHANRSIRKQQWYENGYLANLTTYSISKLVSLVEKHFPKMRIDLNQIWQNQGVPKELALQMELIYIAVFQVLTSADRLNQNVTEWSKSQDCWARVMDKDVEVINGIEKVLIDSEDIITVRREAKKDQKVVNSIEAQMFIVSKGVDYWRSMLEAATQKNILPTEDLLLLRMCGRISSTFIPNDYQTAKIMSIRKTMMSEGFPE